MFRIRKAISKQGGFSIAEVTMAMFLFTASVLGVSFMMLQGSSGINRGRLETIASNLGQRKIEEVKSLPFYVPYDSEAGNKDIDDFYYNPAVSNPNQPSNPLSTAPAYEDYGTIPGFSKFKRVTTVQYQYVSGGVMTPAYMDPNWRPKNATPPQFDRPMGGPNGGPYDVLHALIIKVTVYYQTENGEKTFVVQGIAGDLLITGGTNSPLLVVNSISPTTGYYLYDTNLKMTINVTTPPGTLGPSSTLDVFLWYPGEADVHAKPAPTANSNGTQITCYFDLTQTGVRVGSYNIAVYWQDRGVLDKSLRDAFTVATRPPVITGIGNFNWGYRKQNSRQVTISGNYLRNPSSVQLIGPDPSNTYTINGAIQSSTNTQIVVRFDLQGDATTRPANTRWNLRVTTAGGTDTSDSDAERLWMNPPPNITAVTASNPPSYFNWAYRSLTSRNVRIEGQYLYGLYYTAETSSYLGFGSYKTANATFVSGPYNNDCTADEPVIMCYNPSSAGADSTTNNTYWKVYINNYGGSNASDDVNNERVWMNPPPVLSSLSGWPASAYTGSRQGNNITGLTVNGSYIQNTFAGVYLCRGASPPSSGTTYLKLNNSGYSVNAAGTQITGCNAYVYVNPMQSSSFNKWYNAGIQTDNTLIGGNYYLYLDNGDGQTASLGTAYALNHAQYTITVNIYPNTNWGSVSGAGTYWQDDSYTLTPTANSSSGNYQGRFRVWQEPPGTDQWSYPQVISVSDATASRTLTCRFARWFYDNGNNYATWQQTVNDSPYDNNNYSYWPGDGYGYMKIRSKAQLSFLSGDSGEVGARTNSYVSSDGATTLWFYSQQHDGNNNGASNRSYVCYSSGANDRWNVGSLWGTDDVYDFAWRSVGFSGKSGGYIHINSQTDYSILGGNSTDTWVRYVFIE